MGREAAQFIGNLVGVGLLLAGLFSLAFPRAAWEMKEGWKYENVEPSAAGLFAIRLGGVGSILGGIVGTWWVSQIPANLR